MAGLQIKELEAGTKISFYEILPLDFDGQGKPTRTCVGWGGFGSLYKVARGSKIYALKLAHEPLSALPPSDRQWLEERGDREIAALKSLRHANIVRVHAFDRWPDEDGCSFIVMDFVDGRPLDEWRIKTAPSTRRICEVFRSIALALHAAHRQGIYHRDLKCLNVLVRADGEPVIVDWGLSRPASTFTITRAKEMVGTNTYFAPEYCRWAFAQTAERFETTPATELYSLGFMLYEVLTGRRPVEVQETDVAMMKAILAATPASPSSLNPDVPAEMDELVQQLLHQNPAKRFPTGDALAQRITELLSGASAGWDRPLGGCVEPAHVEPERVDRGSPIVMSKNSGGKAGAGSAGETAANADGSALKEAAKISLASLRKPDFVLDGLESPSPGHPAPMATQVPSAVAAAARRLGAARARRSLPVAVVVAGIVAAALVAIIAVASLGRRDSVKKPEDLLARVQREEAITREPAVATPAEKQEPKALLPPAPVSDAKKSEAGVANLGEAETPTPSRPARRPPDAADIERERQAHFGSPTIRPDWALEKKVASAQPARAKTAAADDDQPAWLKPIQSNPPPAAPASKELGVSSGAHIKARLLTNLDSRTVGDGPVEAKLVRPFIMDGRAMFPSGTVVLGQAQASGSRFTIRFYRLRLPDRREIAFEGLAYDLNERKPGLPASRRIEGTARQGAPLVAKIAKGAAETLLTAATTGDLASSVAAGAGRTALNERGEQASSGQAGAVLLLDENVDFDIFVVHAF
jgi:serine/threonine protein kinase